MNIKTITHLKNITLVIFLGLFSIVTVVISEETQANEYESCMTELIRTASDQLTMGEARDRCQLQTAGIEGLERSKQNSQPDGLVQDRLSVDETNILRPFTLMSHRNNYILFAAHNFQGWDPSPYEEAYDRDNLDVDDTEAQFQLSIKIPLAVDLFNNQIDLFMAYTINSYWQLYNSDYSSPFRETNHEPEVWMQIRPEWNILGFQNTVNFLGINHMSNGQGDSLSRSWNRVFAGFVFEHTWCLQHSP